MNILKQTWAQLRSQRMLTVLGITGTALSIFLIMVVVMIHQIKILPFAPESYRGRMLHVKYALTESENGSASGGMSYTLAKSLTENLPSAEAATIYQNDCSSEIAKVAGIGKTKLDFRAVDDKFWHVFDFRFLQGKPFDKADFDAGLPKAVITRKAALKLFGMEQAVGREFR
ncbi:MAG: ABC transporter permease, partial [Muribaculaceae bacterium]|nr:ABC transporter permease [Muribaculaceae bacterium]